MHINAVLLHHELHDVVQEVCIYGANICTADCSAVDIYWLAAMAVVLRIQYSIPR